MPTSIAYDPWPALSYDEFAPTAYLVHMATQAIGKLKLLTPFEPHWGNVILSMTSRGMTTGPIPYNSGSFSVDLDFIAHRVHCTSSWGEMGDFSLGPMSVAAFTQLLLTTLHNISVKVTINLKPQEVANPIPFDQDTTPRPYNAALVNAWWRILLSTYQVLEIYHARFFGASPPVGFMWGTFDIRDGRYLTKRIPPPPALSGYLRRNAMDVAQVEVGWWHGLSNYQHPAFYAFIYPLPNGIEAAKLIPAAVHWDQTTGQFLLDYDDIRKAKNPAADLLAFFESVYQAVVERAGWDQELMGSGKPL